MSERLILEGGGDFREKRIANVGDNQAQDGTRATGQVTSGLILRIAQVADGGQHALARTGASDSRTVQDMGNGGYGNGRPGGNIFDTYGHKSDPAFWTSKKPSDGFYFTTVSTFTVIGLTAFHTSRF